MIKTRIVQAKNKYKLQVNKGFWKLHVWVTVFKSNNKCRCEFAGSILEN